MSKFSYSVENPYHISVAALLTNERGEIAIHHFKAPDLALERGHLPELYIFMRETLHDSEALEAGVARGLMEEYGATGELVRYIGSIQSTFPYRRTPGRTAEKTTLYFHVQMVSIDNSLREVGEEAKSTIEWHKPEALLEILKAQRVAGARADVDDTKILEDFIGDTE